MEYKLYHSALSTSPKIKPRQKKKAEIERMHAELVIENAKCSRPRVEMDYSHVGLPSFCDQNEKSQPPHEKMKKLEATMAELERLYAEYATSQIQFINETRATLQIQSAKLERLEVQVGQMAMILLEEQQRSLSTFEEPMIEKEYDAKELKDLVVKEDEPTSPKSHEKIKDEVVKTILEMTLWVAMHEEVKNEEKKTLTSEVDEYITHLNNKLRGIIVKKKMKKK